ncbi:hypothetical protein EGR_06139 [Echinococcus granulosus]|uniref:Uncharacterized protein n=1 Tax=Echinococcus granulosus TaxID=6210 RepID=W6UDE4_ECHGR|nr:hypothetical protein EGR_06139 [Echinococcus granulosus]EUB59023.1 hypothetical protein EGR_06139 [Echinococcus granulosus]
MLLAFRLVPLSLDGLSSTRATRMGRRRLSFLFWDDITTSHHTSDELFKADHTVSQACTTPHTHT